MSEASFASLNPTLLARKGGAKPAMRPQLAPLPEDMVDEALEDLGWNDMGGEDGEGENANVVALTPGSVSDQPNSPVLKRQQKDLIDRVLADAVMEGPALETETLPEESFAQEEAPPPAPEPIIVKRKKAPRKPAGKSRRAAFTLRLDTDRHLKLRLAATMKGVSAQALVTEALDSLLDQIEDLDALAQRMKRN